MKTYKMTNKQMFYKAIQKSAEQNALFLDMVRNGMTKSELEALIQRRPSLWSKWANWLDKLPNF